ncbi:MAG: flagellin FliC, partial [Methylophilales bacterium]|nr:flagellin FliC [Methylophilales bacterium]
AGLAIAVRLSGQLAGTAQAARNVGDGISLADTADAALSGVTDSLQRIRELAVQAANGTNSAADLQSIQGEINQLTQGINDINNNANFNGQQLFSGGFTAAIQSGPNAGQTTTLSLNATGATSLGISSLDVVSNVNPVTGVNLGADAAITAVDAALNNVTSQQANIGAVSAGLNSTLANLNGSYENIAASRSRIQDNDFAKSTSDLSSANTLSLAGIQALNAYNHSLRDNLKLIARI